MSAKQTVTIALVPGVAEELDRATSHNMSWNGYPRVIKDARNFLYGSLVAAIGGAATALTSTNASLKTVAVVVGAIGVVGTVAFGRGLYSWVSDYRTAMSSHKPLVYSYDQVNHHLNISQG